jgi:RNA recognition motif-containing protein
MPAPAPASGSWGQNPAWQQPPAPAYAAPHASTPARPPQQTALWLQNVAPAVTKKHIANLFSGLKFRESSISIGHDADGNPTGEAWLYVADEETAQQAIQRFSGRTLLGSMLRVEVWNE